MSKQVLVYGTLRRGASNDISRWDDNVLFMGYTTFTATMFSCGGFPAIELRGEGQVRGEVWQIPDDLLPSLDMYEGYPNLYQRAEIETSLGPAWVYHQEVGSNDESRLIPGGDWLEFRANRVAA